MIKVLKLTCLLVVFSFYSQGLRAEDIEIEFEDMRSALLKSYEILPKNQIETVKLMYHNSKGGFEFGKPVIGITGSLKNRQSYTWRIDYDSKDDRLHINVSAGTPYALNINPRNLGWQTGGSEVHNIYFHLMNLLNQYDPGEIGKKASPLNRYKSVKELVDFIYNLSNQ